MARKRGGIAGFWDRSKKYIKPIATFTAGMVNPALGAAVGAAMGGLDREGKSGIGLDVGGAIKGGVTGYGMGKLGALAKGKAAGLFTGAGKGAASTVGTGPGFTDVTSRIASNAPEMASRVNPAALFSAAPGPSNLSALGKIGGFITKNQGLIGGAAKAGAAVLGQQAQSAQQDEYMALQRERFELEREEAMRERERRERVARLLMSLFDRQRQDIGMGSA